jgi:FkbM family methyltransferase
MRAPAIARGALKRLCRLYPLTSGYGLLANLKPMVWAARGLASPTPTRLRDGSIALVDPGDALGRALYYAGDWDPKITWVCRRLLRPGDTFLDVGAHCGGVALQAAAAVGSEGQVHAFEPNPGLAGMLRESAGRNGYAHLHTHEVALSDADGEAELHLAFGHSFFGSLTRRQGTPGTSIPISVRHAGDHLRHLGRIRLAKIDVEGHEEAVLRGLEDIRPEALIIETDDFAVPYWERGPVSALRELGYRMLGLPRNLLRVRPIPVPSNPTQEFHDSIAVRPDVYEEVVAALRQAP